MSKPNALGYRTEVTTDDVNKRTQELIAQFHEFVAEVRTEPGKADADENEVFDAWVIQKIAGMHVLLLALEERIKETDFRARLALAKLAK